MTITYPLEIPRPNFASIRFIANNIQSVTTSAFSGQRQIQIYPGEFWRAEITWAPEHRSEIAEDLGAFLSSLRGSVGTFLLRDPMQPVPRGAAATNPSSPVVDGSGQQGTSVNIRNAPVSLAGWLIRGAKMQIGPTSRAQLVTVLSDVTTNGTGRATVDIWPRLRAGMIDGDAITLSSPAGLFSLEQDYDYLLSAPFRYEHQIVAREAF